uniref:ABC transporter domain-containing protein n=1 Tax=Panagrolaimus davidi TaxID=227884 RepID=A0A914P039_9BILA
MAPEPSSPIINNGKLFSNTKIHDNGELQVPRERQLSHLDPYSDRVSTVLVWKHLVVSTGEDKDKMVFNKIKSCGRYTHKPKILLNNVSGAITGGLWAVMGPSGSGKSTLLNTLACRLDANTVVEGEMRLNGSKYDNAELKRIAGYVMQDDLLNGSLTVEETLMYTAELRLPRDFTNEQRKQRVRETMSEMGVTHVRDVIIGTPLKKGISGGERKRVCVGMSLLSRPQLLFLDEPTSGLDSVTALDLLHTFNKLAHGGHEGERAVTIVCSIHQPQSKIFDLFDSLVLLKAGNIIYQGPRADAMPTFTKAGFPCPLFTNPADHLMDVITPSKYNKALTDQEAIADSYDQQAKDQAIVDAKKAGDRADQAIVASQEPVIVDLEMGAEKRAGQMNVARPRWLKQVWILIRRGLQEHRRESSVIIASVIQTILIAVLIGTAFLKIGQGQKSTIRRQPVLFFCAVNQGVFGALMVINAFPAERALTLRERASGTYLASAYFVSKIIVDTLVQVPVPIIFTCVVYFLIGLQATAGKFFLFMFFMILCSVSATSLALMISALCRTTDLSVTVLPMALEVFRLFGGFFLSPANLPKYFSWLDALSYVKYSYVGIALNELQGLKLSCEDTAPNANCIPDGETTIRTLGLDYINIGGCIGCLIGYIIICRTIAYFGVRFLKH